MGGFGVLFSSLATLLTEHAIRSGLGLSLTWWSVTFPVGTWATVAASTLHCSQSGQIFLPA